MLALIQRVKNAHVDVGEETTGAIKQGVLALIGVESMDTELNAKKLLEKILNYRIFDDDQGKMNHSLVNIKGGLLLVPQFTLAADTSKGLRPSFSKAAPPEHAHTIFKTMLELAVAAYQQVSSGRFGAEMQVHLVNDGPVTFMLKV